MNDVFVTCIKNGRFDMFGRPLVSGSSYTLSWSLARDLWLSGYVSVTDTAVFDSSSVDVRRPNLAAELAAIGEPVHRLSSRMPFVIFAGDGGSNGLSFTGAAGAFTLSATILSGILLPVGYGWLPANAGGLGNAAGWYFFTMSSETSGIFYNNQYLPELELPQRAPGAPTPFANATPGRITQTTSEVTFTQVTITPAQIGPNGVMQWKSKTLGESSSYQRYVYLRLAGTLAHLRTLTTTANTDASITVRNAGVLNTQCSTRIGAVDGATISGDFTTVDFSSAQPATMSTRISDNRVSVVVYNDFFTVAYGA